MTGYDPVARSCLVSGCLAVGLLRLHLAALLPPIAVLNRVGPGPGCCIGWYGTMNEEEKEERFGEASVRGKADNGGEIA
ncbi:uncharacterized protein SPSK_00361 [Sporothrix schenckii 1099-18]|uniref:Uncharacterized protein n=1 Tax=Sporothrix schenckii 1099-18 TaxID=1397361 RepID=A0A0F2M2V1_SPOSC|nr:uncharacterized protein SPSK_00361 [Sporothrix schenckii 1099-18]KJR84038.1 hypothetical protein SPSK_00361 [Sporothrix schenckii 1099-18]